MDLTQDQEHHEVRSPRSERRGASRATVIRAAKAAVPVIDLADLLAGPGQMRRIGSRWVARCPLPTHTDRTPSFTVFPDDDEGRGRWWCFGCSRGGDVVDLAAAAWGYGDGEMAMAAADVLREYGHELPERPASWYARQRRQKPVRDKIRAARAEVLRRRLFRLIMLPLIRTTTPDADEFRDEVRRAWADFQGVPVETMLDHYDHLGGV